MIQIITMTNCALGRSTILCLYVPGFRRQVFEHVPKCKWIPLTKLQWIPHTNHCNVIFVGTLILLRIPQRTNIDFVPDSTNVSGFCKREWIPQTYFTHFVANFAKLLVLGTQCFSFLSVESKTAEKIKEKQHNCGFN